MTSENLHPYMLSSQNDSPDIWPNANQFVPLAVNPVGLTLFRKDGFELMQYYKGAHTLHLASPLH